MDAVTSKRQKKMSQRQEKQVAATLGGRTVAGSGAGRTSGGSDVRVRGQIRVECKVTEKPFYILSLTDLEKIRDQAIKGGLEQPVLQIRFDVPRGGQFEFAVTPWDMQAPDLFTEKKSMKLNLAMLQVALLRKDAFFVAFPRSMWRICYWTTFMKELDANDQHNP